MLKVIKMNFKNPKQQQQQQQKQRKKPIKPKHTFIALQKPHQTNQKTLW